MNQEPHYKSVCFLSNNKMLFWITVGIALGAGIGVALGNNGTGIGIGVVIGIVLETGMSKREKRTSGIYGNELDCYGMGSDIT